MHAIQTLSHPAQRTPTVGSSKVDAVFPHLVFAGLGRGEATDAVEHVDVATHEGPARHTSAAVALGLSFAHTLLLRELGRRKCQSL